MMTAVTYILLLQVTFLITEICSFHHHRHHVSFLKTTNHAMKKSSSQRNNNNGMNDGDELSSPSPALLQSMTFDNVNTSVLDPQQLSEFLMEIGACSTSVIDCDKGSALERPMFDEPIETNEDGGGIICASSSWLNLTWNICNVTAHFPATFDLETIAIQVKLTFDLDDDKEGESLHYIEENVPSRDWVSHVQSSWKPEYIQKCGFLLRFPWHTDEDVQEVLSSQEKNGKDNDYEEEDIIELKLEGGSAFGTGGHPTTQLCLNWVRNIVSNDANGVTKFLDYGAGSGVLGLAACALSSSNKNFTAIGIDIDLDAVLVADYNAKINNNLPMKSYLPPPTSSTMNDTESMSIIIKSQQRISKKDDTVFLPDAWNGQVYDACVANILAGPLVSLASTLSEYVRPGGFIGISGVLEYQSGDVRNAFIDYFDELKVEAVDDGWVLITGIKK